MSLVICHLSFVISEWSLVKEEEMLRLEDLEVYKLSMDLGEKIWNMVVNWNYFEKDIPINIGSKQLIRAIDSVAANLSEGYGRFFYKENKQFCYYSRGPLYESKTWLSKANKRNLISNDNYESLISDITVIQKKLNAYIKSIGKTKSQIINEK